MPGRRLRLLLVTWLCAALLLAACGSPAAGQPPPQSTQGEAVATAAGAPPDAPQPAAGAQALPAGAPLEAAWATSLAWLPGEAGMALVGTGQAALVNPDAGPFAPQSVQPQQVAPQAMTDPILLTSSAGQPLAAWVSGATQVYLWAPGSSQPQQAGEAGAPVTGLALDPAGGALAVASTDGRVQVYLAQALEPAQFWQAPNWLANLSYSPDGGQVGGADLASSVVYVFNAYSGELLRTLEWLENPGSNLAGAYFAPDWRTLAWAARSAVQLMDVESGQLGPLLNHATEVGALAWSPDGSLLASAAAAQIGGALLPAVYLWDGRSGELLQVIQQREPAASLAFSPDGTQLAALSSSGQLQTWKIQR